MPILCVGQLVADVVVRPVDRMPVPGRTDLAQELRLTAGGCAANTASVLAKLGLDAAVAGVVGRDSLGDAVISELIAVGVDVTPVLRDWSTSTSAVVVLVQANGERSFIYREGGNEVLSIDAVPDGAMSRARVVHVGGAMKLASLDIQALLSRARSMGCVTSLDTDWDTSGRWIDALDSALPHLDYLLTNEEEGRMLTGASCPWEVGRRLLSYGPRAVVVKRGPLGAVVVSGSMEESFPAVEVPVLDTTCAGDGFAAGFLFGLSQGWDIRAAAGFANVVGGLCTTQTSHFGVESLASTLDFVRKCGCEVAVGEFMLHNEARISIPMERPI